MFEKEKIADATREMVSKNDDWREILKYAPPGAFLRIGVAFYASKFLKEMSSEQQDEYREFREMLEGQLDGEDLKYLAESFARMGVDAATEHYKQLFGDLPYEEQQKGEEAYKALCEKVKAEKDASNAGADGADKNGQDEHKESESKTEDAAPVATDAPDKGNEISQDAQEAASASSKEKTYKLPRLVKESHQEGQE